MIVSMIAAMANNRVIGKENQMPWHLPADFAWFKECTMGKPVIMGRKTFESIGRPLPGRRNIVISRNAGFVSDGIEVTDSLEQAFSLVQDQEEVMIIGGGSLYRMALSQASKLYLTYIHADIEGDTVFPETGDGWAETYRQEYTKDARNAYDMSFTIQVKE
ncbi:type 3 dihydrofolate reductase [Vibrio quintilis]|uniref:Dihydrofolate reductase n=1 Tax=Vibrio quintilis TaxID=1117707 RepID=A0A1M7YSM4_9VIBR|nr:type 3 dihydrofolate reductase [Vibrio quintilis]SHO55624.1 Dihydrofolate reductase type 3 [Vibrio quintilis]